MQWTARVYRHGSEIPVAEHQGAPVPGSSFLSVWALTLARTLPAEQLLVATNGTETRVYSGVSAGYGQALSADLARAWRQVATLLLAEEWRARHRNVSGAEAARAMLAEIRMEKQRRLAAGGRPCRTCCGSGITSTGVPDEVDDVCMWCGGVGAQSAPAELEAHLAHCTGHQTGEVTLKQHHPL